MCASTQPGRGFFVRPPAARLGASLRGGTHTQSIARHIIMALIVNVPQPPAVLDLTPMIVVEPAVKKDPTQYRPRKQRRTRGAARWDGRVLAPSGRG